MSASTLCLCVLRQAKTHAQVERASKKITVAGTGFFETKHQLEQQFGLPLCGQGNPPRRLALGDETRIGFCRSKKAAKNVIWHPHGRLLLVALFVCIYFFDRRCETAALRVP